MRAVAPREISARLAQDMQPGDSGWIMPAGVKMDYEYRVYVVSNAYVFNNSFPYGIDDKERRATVHILFKKQDIVTAPYITISVPNTVLLLPDNEYPDKNRIYVDHIDIQEDETDV